MEITVGKRLDNRYDLLELIGSGGMADIYRAKDIKDGKTVAVKILKTELAGNADFLRKFRNECRAISLLQHENIVRIFDVAFDGVSADIGGGSPGVANARPYIVMEYVEGITLADYIEKQGQLKWREAISFTAQILRALAKAHDDGIIHRDVKPANVMLLADRNIKVMDFGIARFNRDTNKTVSEKAIGSVHYISPEQARGEETDEKSDIYSCGIMLYEMLTGTRPFDGSTPVSIAMMHIKNTADPIDKYNNSAPKGLCEVVEKAMQKEPGRRYKTAGEMARDLETVKKNPNAIFEYKYYSERGETKYFDKVGNPMDNSPYARNLAAIIEEDEATVRNPLLPILFAVASVFVILTAILIFLFLEKSIGIGSGGALTEGEVPNLVGMEYQNANSKYQKSLYLIAEYESSDQPPGVIVSQDVAAGTVIKGRKQVAVVVSLGAKVVDLPDYTAYSVNDVRIDLANQGLENVTFKRQLSRDVQKEYVIKTDPPAHTMVKVTDPVTVFISNGMEGTTTTVPNFVSLPLVTATELEAQYGVHLNVTYQADDNVPAGTVLSQSIAAQTQVDFGAEIGIVVSSGKPVIKSYTISMVIPPYTGHYMFEYYIDGVQQANLTSTYDLSEQGNMPANRTLEWETSESGGTHKYTIYITNNATQKRAMYGEYTLSFDGSKAISVNEPYLNRSVLADISDVPAATPADTTGLTEPPVVTEPPAVTTAPLYEVTPLETPNVFTIPE